MATVKERINLFAQQLTTMTADVTTLQSELTCASRRVPGEAGYERSKDQECL